MMHTRVVSDDGLRCAPSGFAIDVRLPWYRSLPLSVVEVKSVEIDDEKIELDRVRIELNGARRALSELRPRTQEFWFVLDSALLHVEHSPLEPGSRHEVAVTIAIRPPYVPGYQRVTRTQKMLVAR